MIGAVTDLLNNQVYVPYRIWRLRRDAKFYLRWSNAILFENGATPLYRHAGHRFDQCIDELRALGVGSAVSPQLITGQRLPIEGDHNELEA